MEKKTAFSNGSKYIFLALVCILFATIAAGCRTREQQPAYQLSVTSPPPTINSAFIQPTRFPTSTPLPTLTPVPLPTATEIIPTETILIFGDRFHPDWGSLEVGTFTEIETGEAFGGTRYLRVIPREFENEFVIRILEGNDKAYKKENIFRFSFYLRSPDADLDPRELVLKLQGSNENLHWVENDSSTNDSEDFAFLYTQFTFFEISAIPQGEWVYVEVIPEDQVYDPVYSFFTGFILGSRLQNLPEYHLDQIEITLKKE